MKKKHKLLKYAYDNYPKGTKCGFSTESESDISDGIFDFDDQGDITDKNSMYVFVDGNWATIFPHQRKFVTISEDGVPLFKEDSFYGVYMEDGVYIFDKSEENEDKLISIKSYLMVRNLLGDYKLFSTKQAAEAFIEKHHPTTIEVLDMPSFKLTVNTKGMQIEHKIAIPKTHFSISDVQRIIKAFNEVNKL